MESTEFGKRERFIRILMSAGFQDITLKYYSDKHYDRFYTAEQLADYSLDIKRAFKKGNYVIDFDYVNVWLEIGEHNFCIHYSEISDKLIAVVLMLSGLKGKAPRYKFGRYSVEPNELYDAILNSYPYSCMNQQRKRAIEEARIEIKKCLALVESFV